MAAAVAVAVTLVAGCAGNELRSDVAEATSTTAPPTAPRPTAAPSTSAPGSGPTTTLPTPEPPGPETGFPADWQPKPLAWEACPDDPEAECAYLAVPLDWSQPAGDQISLAVARYRAEGERAGALFVNPGGPGASGLRFLFRGGIDREELSGFDIVSWDPRGVGASTSFTCGAGLPSFLGLDPDPDTIDEVQALHRGAQSAFAECSTSPGDAALLRRVGTDDAARDLEALRMALEDERLNYIGFSYGTYIGERYLDFFPTRVRAMVLDGVIDPRLGLTKILEGQTEATDAVLTEILADCEKRPACTVRDPVGTYTAVRSRLESSNLPGESPDEPLTAARFDSAAIFATYDPVNWNEFLDGLAEAATGDGARLARMADRYRDSVGFTAYTAVTCLDSVVPRGGNAWDQFVAGLRLRSPRLGGAIGYEMLPCATWPVEPIDSTGEVVAERSPAILVVGNRGDNATPYAWAEAVADMLANGHLLTYEGKGHTSYGRDDCVDAIVHRYVNELAVPPEGATCAGGGGGAGAA